MQVEHRRIENIQSMHGKVNIAILQPEKFRLDAALQSEFNLRNSKIDLKNLSALLSATFRGGSHINVSYFCQDCLYEGIESFRVDGQAFVPAQYLPTFMKNFSQQFGVQFGVDGGFGIQKQGEQLTVAGRVGGVVQKETVQTGIWINRAEGKKPSVELGFKVNGIFSKP